jgi:hypothetical protein
MARPRHQSRAVAALATALATSLLATTSTATSLSPCSFSPGVFGDHMVLQRAPAAAMVFGFGAPGDTVTASVDGLATPPAIVGPDGIWRAALPPMPAGGPHTIGVACASGGSAKLQDVLFGDVYFCSGACAPGPRAEWGDAEYFSRPRGVGRGAVTRGGHLRRARPGCTLDRPVTAHAPA